MAPKKNPKKANLDKEVANTVEVVKQYWPDYPITVDSIRHPTREFVLKFYNDCLTNLDEKFAFLTRASPPIPPNLSDEDVLYLRMSTTIPHLAETGFKIGDLYSFDPKRLKTYVLIITRFLMVTESMMDNMVAICNRAFNQASSIENNKNEIQKLKAITLQRQIDLATAKNVEKKLKQTREQLVPKYAKVLELIKETKQKCKDTILEIAKLNTKVDNVFEEIKRLEDAESQLINQIVTREEFENLQATYQQLVKEEELLAEIEEHNCLLTPKHHQEQIESCLQELNCLDLPEKLFALADLRAQLKNEKWNVNHLTSTQESTKVRIAQLKAESDKEYRAVDQENSSLCDTIKRVNENALHEFTKCETKYGNILKSKEEEEENYIMELQHKKEEYGKVETELQKQQYILLGKLQALAENFENFLAKVNDFKKTRRGI